MYGHPAGCSEDFLYKEPYEFIPHVLWLLSDSQDRKDCPCKPCHRATGRKVPRSLAERLQADIAAKHAASQAAATVPEKPKKAAPAKTAAATRKKAAATDAGSKTSAKESPVARTIKKTPATKAAAAAAPVVQQTTPTAGATSNATLATTSTPTIATAQVRLVNNEPTLFRQGEMVWYQQDPGWRIGVIRQVGAAPTYAYTIVPLGHYMMGLPDLVRQQGQMRPFLTFSVPGVEIENMQNKVFSEVPWQDLVNAYAGRWEVVGLEASKMAAIEIDSSWSVFNQLPAGPTQPRNQVRYDGVFLGAEMIRRGDPIRSKDKSKGTLLEVAEIIVTTITSVPNPGAPHAPPTTQDTLAFRGIEYEATLVPEQTHVPNQPQGMIFAKDTAFRSAAAKAGGANSKCIWTVRKCKPLPCIRHNHLHVGNQVKSWDVTWQEREVAGRSYVTDELIHVAKNAAAVQQALETGKFTEASAFLNNRMQSAAARNMSRRRNRRTTIGHAISQAHPLVLGEGIMEDP